MSGGEDTADTDCGVFRAVNGVELWTMHTFAEKYPLFPNKLLLAYKIYTDIMLQQEYDEVLIKEGTAYESDTYCFEVKKAEMHRVLIPILYSGNLDMAW